MAILVIARLAFQEAVRRRIVLAASLLGLTFLVLYNLGFYYIRTSLEDSLRSQGTAMATLTLNEVSDFLLMAGLYAVNFLAIAMAALISADTLAGEIGSGTIQTLVAKPVRRAEIVLGKWLGFAGLLGLYLLLMAGGVMLSAWLQSRYIVPNILTGLGLMYLTALVMMSITLMCSSLFSTLATGGIVFGMYGLAFIGGWVEQFGTFLENSTAVDIGILSSLLMPTEALWHRAAFEMSTPLVQSLGFGATPFSVASVPSPFMVVYAGLYLLAALGMTIWQFRQRDL